MIKHQLAVLKARLLQMYYDLKAFEELPFQLINGDYEDRRVTVPVPRKKENREEKNQSN